MIANFPVWGKIANVLPSFTYTGSYEEHTAADYGLSGDYTVIALLTDGVLQFAKSADVDIFMVGGGGGSNGRGKNNGYTNGGGGGYTKTYQVKVPITEINVTIGKGSTGRGGTTIVATADASYTAEGGYEGGRLSGGNGGSGGGAGAYQGIYPANRGGNGGSDGSDGFYNDTGSGSGPHNGLGQGTTTRAFGDPNGKLFAGGGGGGGGGLGGEGGGANNNNDAVANTGGGAGGNWTTKYRGGSGIVLIRPKQS